MLNLIEKARCAKVLAGVAAGMCVVSMAEARSITVGFGENVILDGSGGGVQQLVAAGNGSTTTVVGTQEVENAIVTNLATMNLGPNGRIDRLTVGLGGTFNQAGGSVGNLRATSATPTINIAGGRVEELSLDNGRPTVNIGGGQIDTISLQTLGSTINIFADTLTDIRVNGLSLPGETSSDAFEPFDLLAGEPEVIIDGEILFFITAFSQGFTFNDDVNFLPLDQDGQPATELLLETLVLDVEFPGDVAGSIVFDFDGFDFLDQNQQGLPFSRIALSNSAGFPGPRVIDGGIAVVPAPAAAGAGLIGLVSLAGRRRRSAV